MIGVSKALKLILNLNVYLLQSKHHEATYSEHHIICEL